MRNRRPGSLDGAPPSTRTRLGHQQPTHTTNTALPLTMSSGGGKVEYTECYKGERGVPPLLLRRLTTPTAPVLYCAGEMKRAGSRVWQDGLLTHYTANQRVSGGRQAGKSGKEADVSADTGVCLLDHPARQQGRPARRGLLCAPPPRTPSACGRGGRRMASVDCNGNTIPNQHLLHCRGGTSQVCA